MGRHHTRPPNWRSIRVPLRVVESAYGRGNYDDAGEDMAYALRRVSQWPDQYACRFNFDTSHPNPWYHAMVFEVDGVPLPVLEQLVELLVVQGLIPEGN